MGSRCFHQMVGPERWGQRTLTKASSKVIDERARDLMQIGLPSAGYASMFEGLGTAWLSLLQEAVFLICSCKSQRPS